MKHKKKSNKERKKNRKNMNLINLTFSSKVKRGRKKKKSLCLRDLVLQITYQNLTFNP